MYRLQRKFSPGKLAKTCLLLMPLIVPAVAVQAIAKDSKGPKGPKDSIPLVYNVENRGANFKAPWFPSFDELPIIRPLPDPFVFFKDGKRDTSFSKWSERRNEIFGAVQKYMLGPKPDCRDCTIVPTFVPSATNPLQGTLTINVTRNGISSVRSNSSRPDRSSGGMYGSPQLA